MATDTPGRAATSPMAPHRIYADFLAPDEQAALLALALASEGAFEASRLRGGKVDPQVRRSRSLRGLAPMDGVLRRRVRARLPSLVADLRVSSFVPSRIELEMVVHGDGDHFSRHIDTAVGAGDDPPKGDRVISGVYYFHREPKGFEGGELRLHAFGVADAGFVDIEPRPNILVAFPSFAPHEVLPVRQPSPDFAGSRFAVNCWIYRERSTDAV